ncbi:MAG: ABC transporter permease, partial [Actinomycetota bacterium]|nr:ABC transporter permease [Actinomycetota bacterium]
MELAGAGELYKLFQRRDRIKLPVAIYVMIGVTVSSAFGFRHLYSTAHDRLTYASGVNSNSAELFMYGPVFNGSTLGGLTAWRSGAIGGVILGLINILLVIRHTRAEEESGRAELVGSAVVGRYAVLTSALLLALVTNLVSAAVIIGGLCVLGLPAGGATALALGLAGVGLLFAGVAAVTAQLSESARTARGMAVVVLAADYLLRGVGDAQDSTGHSWLNWLSPIGWTQRLRAFSGDHWLVLALYVIATAVLITLAFALAARRDLGAGIFADRLGPAHGAASLRSSFALAWR